MSRPHIEFIAAFEQEARPWQLDDFGVAAARALSRDDQSGAATELIQFPAGWSAPTGAFSADVEIFMLNGRMQIGTYRLRQHSYAHLPAGVCSGPWKAQEATIALWMPAATPHFVAAGAHATDTRLDRYIPGIDTTALPWCGTITPGFPPGAMRKTLRCDAESGANTWLLGVLPQWRDNRVEIHPVVEEAYVLLGEMNGPGGTMTPGSYFWRPPFIPHGPFSADTGALIFFRSDGPLRTDYLWPEP
jgi:hypothetical protein